MTTKTTKAKPTCSTLIVFGQDSEGRNRAGKFKAADSAKATEAAKALGLAIAAVSTSDVTVLAKSLPDGDVYAAGAKLVPIVSSSLYERVQEIIKRQASSASQGLSSDRSSGTAAEKQIDGHRLPTSWQDLRPGDLVLSQNGDPGDGWWRAVVVRVNGETVLLKWLQSFQPKKPFLRHYSNLGLFWPGQDLMPGRNKAQTNAIAPSSWGDIAEQHTILAPEDGPIQQFWEGIALKVTPDTVTLRWRDYEGAPEAKRLKTDLALLFPIDGKSQAVKSGA